LTRTLAFPSALAALLATLVLAPSASAAITASSITTPTGPYIFFADQTSAVDFRVHGTATGTGDVDIVCYTEAGGRELVSGPVPVNGGVFDVDVTMDDAYQNITNPCVLRAVPDGDGSAHPPDASGDAFTGPLMYESWGAPDKDGSGNTIGFDYQTLEPGGQFELTSAGGQGIEGSSLFQTGTLAQTTAFFEVEGYLNNEAVKIDGTEADVASYDALSTGVPPIESTETLDQATGAMTITDREPLVRCASEACTSYVSANVELDRTWTTGNDGAVVNQTDSWRSTDGASHPITVSYPMGTNDSGGTAAYLFPGNSEFEDHAVDDAPALPAGPGTVFNKQNGTTPDAGDGIHPQGAVTYASRPDADSFSTSDETSGNYSEWDARYVRTIPASGALTLRFSYAQAFALSDVKTMAAQAVAGFAPSIAITSPANGSGSATPNVTVAGTASGDAGIESVTVNGQSASVNGSGAWSAPITLAPGANTVTAVATDNDGITSQKQITLTYTPPVPPPPPPPVAHLSLAGAPHVLTNGVSFRVSCASADCSGAATLTATEVLKVTQKLTGVTSRVQKKTVKVSHVSFSLKAGAHKTVTVRLNSLGRKLLRRFKRLPVKLSVTLAPTAGGKAQTVATKKVTIKTKRKRR
jgi:hypothetical protein